MENPYARYDKNNIELECSSCLKQNSVNLSSDIKCKECNKSLSGRLYKSVLVLTAVSASTLVGVGAVSGALIDDTLNLNRASVEVEYKMMRTCINEFRDRDNCFCAVESMSGFLDAKKARFYSKDKLALELKERYINCQD